MSRALTVSIPCMNPGCHKHISLDITVTSDGYGGNHENPPEAPEWFVNAGCITCSCGFDHEPESLQESDSVNELVFAAILDRDDDADER